jgi:hypothetical protein
VAEKNDGRLSFEREKPTVQPSSILGMEIHVLIVQVHIRGDLVKRPFRKENKEVFNLWIKEIKRGYNNNDQRDQVWPCDWHKDYPPDFLVRVFQKNRGSELS